ncbi:MAG: hypothetical protein IPM79_18130 [Polyangiaceae bacterium]|nr:hypothetical protein [Polyangiaceae bacterium]MBK8939484.1 hypothetical protein [Polyangiaceae bacterium]
MLRRLLALSWMCCIGCSNGVEPIDAADDVAHDVAIPPAQTQAAGAASSAPPAEVPAPPEPVPATAERFQAVVRVSKEGREPDGKRKLVFSGVTLDREGAPQVVATYSPSKVWDALDGRKVSALGDPYTPQGRSIGGVHMSILEIAVVGPKPDDTVLGFGRTKELAGKLSERKGEPGSKRAGVSFWVLETKDKTYEVFDVPERITEEKGEVRVMATVLVVSDKLKSPVGPLLWIRGKAKESGDP